MTQQNDNLQQLSLGKAVEYTDQYAPHLLQGVPRSMNRQELNIVENQPFHGEDIWNGYELSWLNDKGKPCVAIMQVRVPATSPNLIESKSFKLYLNGFNQTRVNTIDELQRMLQHDLSQCAGQQVEVTLFTPAQFATFNVVSLPGTNIDLLDIEVNQYQPNVSILETSNNVVSETLCSDLLKSNCLITHQPDWASIAIRYEGPAIDHASFLRYLISFRQHNEFHEQCVERIFCDIQQQCKPDKLTVYARYTRRGGLDINPFRSNFEPCWPNGRLARQ
ncbi:NADPH-dependent 7-cyano-7-deazaguanine reductase QueF [Neptunicella marina]|uniref:NADPH-dependent 7-cyano-7-deazaguanine reductase n=1 Tax=Neptunicella marina TaxID=2125989 RepID=A0A8J6IT10_9ALTE|nr:NADPH-dependent 7-cyano-7-deazaguanine reductase QueF [Neptunicella marina]MBC3764908.1 NADPH-dependent 7-cyano-7-deazaguanine reductase QueF [Neptunicella marina]